MADVRRQEVEGLARRGPEGFGECEEEVIEVVLRKGRVGRCGAKK